MELGGVGCRRAGQRVRHRALAHRLFRAQRRPDALARTRRRGARPRRADRGAAVDGGELAQQSPRYPGSARIGLNDDQPDPGWWFVLVLERLGLAWNIKTPATMPARPALVRVSNDDGGCPACRSVMRWWRGARSARPLQPLRTGAQ